MSRNNDLEMSGSSPSLYIGIPGQERCETQEPSRSGSRSDRSAFTLSRQYSPLGHGADDPVFRGTSTATPSLQDREAGDVAGSTDTLIQSSTSRAPYLKKLSDPEPPKKVCKNGMRSALGHLALFHLPAIGITLTILSLYIARVRWEHPSAEELSVLQFAAKAHEILIIISLTDILLHRVRYGLIVDKNGIPLGFLSSPVHLGAPIQYLFSWELWGVVLQPSADGRRGRLRVTGFIIILAILLSIAAAPLSAIEIIPRQGWQQVHIQPKPSEIIAYLKGQPYETDLDSNRVKLYEVHETFTPTQEALLTLLTPTMRDPPEENEFSSARQIANFSYSNYDLTTTSRLISLTMDIPDLQSANLVVATCPLDSVVEQINQYWRDRPVYLLTKSKQTRLNSSDIKRWRQPLLVIECSQTATTGPDATFSFSSNISDSSSLLDADKSPAFRDLLKDARKKKSPKLGYLPLDPPDAKTSSISAEMLFVTDSSRKTDDGELKVGEPEGKVWLELCRINARWAEADVWMEHATLGSVQSQLDSPLFNIHDHFGSSFQSGITIKMRQEWLTALGQRISFEGGVSDKENSTYQQIRGFCYSDGPGANFPVCLTVALAAHITDALSHTSPLFGYSEGSGQEYPSDPAPGPSDTIFHNTYFIGGYAYDFQRSRTIPFAFSILLLHVTVVLIHVAMVLSSRHPWHGSSWSSFGQILVLALRSRAPGSVGGGVESSQTWKTTASVRVTSEVGRLEMMLRNREASRGQVQDLEDGSDAEGVSSGIFRVEPGIRYH
ncbi:hypothetical protein ACJZ2D_015150 [Fusarium nematophilum]